MIDESVVAPKDRVMNLVQNLKNTIDRMLTKFSICKQILEQKEVLKKTLKLGDESKLFYLDFLIMLSMNPNIINASKQTENPTNDSLIKNLYEDSKLHKKNIFGKEANLFLTNKKSSNKENSNYYSKNGQQNFKQKTPPIHRNALQSFTNAQRLK